MDQKACEESAKNASNIKCEKNLHEVGESIACPTPQKMTEPLPTKSKESQTQLPEKHRTLANLFCHMSCSLRLLHLRKKSPTFQNVCTQVEILAKRKFSYAHLAQMKYILPEGMHIDKVLVHDKKSLCVKPDMKITLLFEIVDEHSKESADMALRRYFSSRLINFFNMHPEAIDIPEAILPEPFSRRTHSLIFEDLPVDSSAKHSLISKEIELLPEKSHFYPSFSRHFSHKNFATKAEKVQCFSSSQTSLSSDSFVYLDNQGSESRCQKECAPLSDYVTNLNTERGQYPTCVKRSVINTPVHMICHPNSVGCSSESPDIKIVSSADDLMTDTPAQSSHEILMPISDVKHQNMTVQKSTSCHKPAKRVLEFSLMEGNDSLDARVDKLESGMGPHESDGIPKCIGVCSEDCDAAVSVALPQEVEESLGCSLEETNQIQANLDTWHKKSSSLLDLVDLIQSIFLSVKRSPITKEELLQKIIMNSLDFVEIREVEEQVEFLEKLVPDWIFKKLVPTGDIMYCIKQVSDLDSVRSRLGSNMSGS